MDFRNIETTGDLIKKLNAITTPSNTQSQFLTSLNSTFPQGTVTHKALEIIKPNLPKFVYFSNYSRMPGIVSLDLLKSKVDEEKVTDDEQVFLALLESVNTTVDELQSTPRFEELKAALEGISNDISTKIFSYWSQNRNLEVQFSLDHALPQDDPPYNTGQIFHTRIRNNRHKVTVPFDERSTGFVWFFSFLIWFSQVKRNYGENLIILLDEPGLSLHARAQEDLLRYIHDELVPYYQVFYTTHSPFMVDQDFDNVRTVEDVIARDSKLLGTKIGDEVLSTDEDTIFPLQAALGYNITQTLFIGKNTLLVEGPSDLLYLKWFSYQLSKQGKEPLDKRWVITPMGGLDKVSSFVALFKGNKLNVVVFTDFHSGDKKKIQNLKALKILQESAVFTADTYSGKAEADIEDLIGDNTYRELVNAAYALTTAHKLKRQKSTTNSKRILEEVVNHFRTLPAEVQEFDHYYPAEFLTSNSGELLKKLPELEAAFERFEKLFKELNTHISN